MKRHLLAAAVGLIFAGALFLRVWTPYDLVFRGSEVNYQEGDAWYHMRLVENFVHHPPHRIGYDPYVLFPGGQEVAIGPFYDVLLGWIVLAAGLGSPSPYLIHAIGAWYSAVLGALITIPVFFIGRAMFGRIAGLLAAVLIGTMPGVFLRISQLGFPDHHVAEALFTTVTMLLLLKAAQALESDVGLRRVALYSAAAGVALGAYLCTWVGGSFILVILVMWSVGQCFVDRLRNHPRPHRAAIPVAVAFPVAMILFLPARHIPYATYSMLMLVAGIAAVLGLGAMARLRISRKAFLLLAAGAALAIGAIVTAVSPQMVRSIAGLLQRFSPNAPYVAELRPLLYFGGSFSLVPAWANFGASFFLAAIGLPYLCWQSRHKPAPAVTLFLLWSGLTYAAAFGQIRMIAYAAVPVALLSAFVCCAAIARGGRVDRALAWTFVAGAVIAPNLPGAVETLRQDSGPSTSWTAALTWLRTSTPEPFGARDFFFAQYPHHGGRPAFPIPPEAYGVMCWWDYGYWITSIAHRIPISNPTQAGTRDASRFFAAQDEETAGGVMRKAGARYVVANAGLPFWDAPYFTANASTGDAHRYFEPMLRSDGSDQMITVYYPEYFQTMAVRLFAFEGRPAIPHDSTWVIERRAESGHGRRWLRLAFSRQFEDYESAIRWREEQWRSNPGTDLRIASLDAFRSCVPVDALRQYRLRFRSSDGEGGPPVKIFEFQ